MYIALIASRPDVTGGAAWLLLAVVAAIFLLIFGDLAARALGRAAGRLADHLDRPARAKRAQRSRAPTDALRRSASPDAFSNSPRRHPPGDLLAAQTAATRRRPR